jgi:hypothetical protein
MMELSFQGIVTPPFKEKPIPSISDIWVTVGALAAPHSPRHGYPPTWKRIPLGWEKRVHHVPEHVFTMSPD